ACADGTAMQCGRVGGCLLYLRSSESNDFGDLFLFRRIWHPVGGALVSSAPTKQSFIRRVWHPAIPTLPPMVRDSNFVVYLYDILFINLFFIVIIYAFMV
ncbi:hypothetical protein, partial [Leyella stercorea]|uniref:hypothetical protein n=1 Tax=Leyella stercorea TaxID=363265 RepID=UPI0024301681